MSRVDYEVAGREARRFELGNNEFLRVEIYDDYFSLGWSTSLPISDSIERLSPLLARPTGVAYVVDDSGRPPARLPANDAVQRMSTGPRSPGFARLELSSVTLVLDQQASNSNEPAEIAILARVFDEAAMESALRSTGTPSLVDNAADLIQRIAYIGDHIPHGRLT